MKIDGVEIKPKHWVGGIAMVIVILGTVVLVMMLLIGCKTV